MPSVAIATFNSPGYQDLADLTLPAKRRYCERHGYALESGIYDTTKPDWKETLSWDRFTTVYNLLDRYDIIMWSDADSMVMNHDVMLESIIGENEFCIAADLNGLNTGTFLVRSTPMTRQLLYVLLTMGRQFYYNHIWREQEALIRFISTPPYRDWVTWVPQRAFNSYLTWLYPWPKDVMGRYRKGDFMVQLAGIPYEARLEWARAILDSRMPYPEDDGTMGTMGPDGR